MDAGPAVKHDQMYYQEGAERGEGSAAPEKAVLDLDDGPKDVEYASIDFSVLKRRSHREAEKKPETEYAEIKKKVKNERQENGGGEEGEMSEGKDDKVMMEEDEKMKRVPEEEEGEDTKLYSNVKNVLGEI